VASILPLLATHYQEIAPMRFSLSAVAAAALTTIVFLPEAALASCIGDICVSGQDQGNIHVISFSVDPNSVFFPSRDHYNYNDGHGQRELGINETQVRMTIPAGRPRILHYAFQICNRNSIGKSLCGKWANFTHTVQ
jgi:hypothetical protein